MVTLFMGQYGKALGAALGAFALAVFVMAVAGVGGTATNAAVLAVSLSMAATCYFWGWSASLRRGDVESYILSKYDDVWQASQDKITDVYDGYLVWCRKRAEFADEGERFYAKFKRLLEDAGANVLYVFREEAMTEADVERCREGGGKALYGRYAAFCREKKYPCVSTEFFARWLGQQEPAEGYARGLEAMREFAGERVAKLSAADLTTAKGDAATSGPNIDALYREYAALARAREATVIEEDIFAGAVMKTYRPLRKKAMEIFLRKYYPQDGGGAHAYLGVSWEAVKADLEGGGGKLVERYSYWDGGSDKVVLSGADIVHDAGAMAARASEAEGDDEAEDALGKKWSKMSEDERQAYLTGRWRETAGALPADLEEEE